MAKHATGYDYVPDGGSSKVLKSGELSFACAGLDHGHIFAMTQAMLSTGAECKYVWDSDPKKVAEFLKRFPNAKAANSFEQILDDAEIKLVANASIPANRFDIGECVLKSGKNFFVDKPPFTTLEQLEKARKLVAQTGKVWMPYFAERVHNQAAEVADELIKDGEIGKVLQVLILAPHRLSKSARPSWFFKKQQYGGILCDIGSHQFEQFLQFTGAKTAQIKSARVENFANRDTPELEDFGEALLETDTKASCYCRVDWFTPDSLPVWGDGRTFILGTKGYIEVRKYIDFSRPSNPPQTLYINNHSGMRMIDCLQKGFPFFEKFALDILNGTQNAMTQEHAFEAARLSLEAQALADAQRAKI